MRVLASLQLLARRSGVAPGTRQTHPDCDDGPAKPGCVPGGATAPPAACRFAAPLIAFSAYAAPSDVHSHAQAPRPRLGPPGPRAARVALCRRAAAGKKRPGRLSPPMRCGHAAACTGSPKRHRPRAADGPEDFSGLFRARERGVTYCAVETRNGCSREPASI